MNVEILYRPAQTLAKVSLNSGESIVAESGAMVGMSTNVEMKTKSGGLTSGLKRMFGGESFFLNTFRAQGSAGEVLLGHSLCGDMALLDVDESGYFLQSSAFVASTPNVKTETKLGGMRTLFGGEGLFLLRVTSEGAGKLLLGAFGGIAQLHCDEYLVVDTGHLVGWDTHLNYSVGKSASGWLESFLSGEGLVCHFSGRGRIWIQTRSPSEYGHLMGRLLPPREG